MTPGAQVVEVCPGTWRLEIPSGPAGRYRLGQLDDYSGLRRRAFLWRPPFSLALRARASAGVIPGTWGFGLWNDPFSMGLLSGSGLLRLPALPNAVWFFFAAPPNHLSLRDDLPAQGWLAATFRSPRWSFACFALGAPLLPFLLLPPVARLFRCLARRIIAQDAMTLPCDPTEWHTYRLEWEPESARFQVDGETVLLTGISPRGPLGLVLWVDNQFAALSPSGRFRYGTSQAPEAVWIEISDLVVTGFRAA